MMFKYLFIIVVLLLIVLFTYLFYKIRNPLTNLHLYYKDCTLHLGVDIINEIYSCFNLINYYSIYIFKTNDLPKFQKTSYSFSAYTIEIEGGEYYVILVSNRYKILSLLDTDDIAIIGIKDGIVNIPYVPWCYHKFHLSINKLTTLVPEKIKMCNPIIIHDGIIVDNKLDILNVDFETIKKELFKCYVIRFSD